MTSAEDLSTPLPDEGPDEVRSLAGALNGMLARLQASTAATRRFAADAGHELRTPLTGLRANLDTLARNPDLPEAERAALLRESSAEQDRIVHLLEGLQALARGEAADALPREDVELGDLVDAAVYGARRRHPGVTYELREHDAEGATVHGWANGLRLVVDNLLENAALHGGGRVDVDLAREDGRWLLRVADDGPGDPGGRARAAARAVRARARHDGAGHRARARDRRPAGRPARRRAAARGLRARRAGRRGPASGASLTDRLPDSPLPGASGRLGSRLRLHARHHTADRAGACGRGRRRSARRVGAAPRAPGADGRVRRACGWTGPPSGRTLRVSAARRRRPASAPDAPARHAARHGADRSGRTSPTRGQARPWAPISGRRALRERRWRTRDGEAAGAGASPRGREAGCSAPRARAGGDRRAVGLGPLEPLLADPEVEEIMVSDAAGVGRARRRLERTDVAFAREADLREAIERILAPLGRRVDEAEPLADARLPDGSRVNVVIPPLALDGPALTIRRFRRRGFTPEDLVANGTLSRPLLDFLARAVRCRATILVCGGTGSGKTTTLNALSSFIGAAERVVTIEDAAELSLRQPHVVRLEARPPNVEGRGEVTIRRLVRNALRMRPDRIVVGEVRGGEALDLLTALSTGHDGSLSTVHAGSPAEALRRIETLALMAGLGLPHAALREQVADAFDLVVCQARAADGTRRVVAVAEVVRVAGGAAARELYALARRARPLARRALRPARRPRSAVERRASREHDARRRSCSRFAAAGGGRDRRRLGAARRGRGHARRRRRWRAWSSRSRGPAARGASRPRRSGAGSRCSPRARCWRPAGCSAGRCSRCSPRPPARRSPSRWCARARAATRPRCGAARRRPRGRWPTRSASGHSVRGAIALPRPAACRARRATSSASPPARWRSASPPQTCSSACAAAPPDRPGTRSSPGSCSSATPAATSPRCCASSRARSRPRPASRPTPARRPPRRASPPGSCSACRSPQPRLAELAAPGFAASLLAQPLPAALVAAAAFLQVVAMLAIRRLA